MIDNPDEIEKIVRTIDRHDPSIRHPFEVRGLGLAPFSAGAVEDGHGRCAYCGKNPIRVLCHVTSSDGKRFIVGNECVKRADDEDLHNAFSVSLARILRRIAQERREAEKEARRQEREQQSVNAERQRLEAENLRYFGGFADGQRVVHPKRGAGKVTRSCFPPSEGVRVEFDNGRTAYVARETLTVEGA